MIVTEEMRKEMLNDMKICDDAQESKIGSEKLYKQFIAKYTILFPNFHENIDTSNNITFTGVPDYRHELMNIKARLHGYILRANTNIEGEDDKVVSAEEVFLDAKKKLDNNTSQSDEVIDEAYKKLNEVRKILSEDLSKRDKWSKIKPIMNWAMENGLDIAIIFLPVILLLE